ncbi:hypothetical protein FS749_008041 [Ceratobasidium sp. UAMH 11750]|nr:hypothetical protein FS749_008041 [Ceratobasidium sp. UAMH 11750]
MHAFTRLTSFLLFVLSLSFLACAVPTTAAVGSKDLAARCDNCGKDVLGIAKALKADVFVFAEAVAKVDTVAKVEALVNPLIVKVKGAAEKIRGLGVLADVDAVTKAQIVAEVVAIIYAILQVCLSLSAKLGLSVLVAIFAELDACLQLFLLELGICIAGIVELILKLLLGACAKIFVELDFGLCLGIFSKLGLALGL